MDDGFFVFYVGSRELIGSLGRLEREPHVKGVVVKRDPDGFQNGLVTNLERASHLFERMANELCDKAGLIHDKVRSQIPAYAVLGNAQLKTYTFSSSLYFHGFPRCISTHDVQAVIDQTRSIATLPLTEFVLQVVPVAFVVNDLENVADPLGLEAQRLGVTLKIFTMPFEAFKNISRAFEIAEISVKGYFPKILTSSEAVLTSKEKDEGALLVDINSNATFLTHWKKGELVHSHVLPVGTNYLGSEIAKQWQIEERDAEKVKDRFANLNSQEDFGEELIPLLVRNGIENCPIKRQDFQKKFLECGKNWMAILLKGVQDFVHEEGIYHPQYVFTGEGPLLDGFLEFLQEQFAVYGRIGYSRQLDAPPELVASPAMTSFLGMYLWLAYEESEIARFNRPRGFIQKTLAEAKSWFTAYF